GGDRVDRTGRGARARRPDRGDVPGPDHRRAAGRGVPGRGRPDDGRCRARGGPAGGGGPPERPDRVRTGRVGRNPADAPGDPVMTATVEKPAQQPAEVAAKKPRKRGDSFLVTVLAIL